MAHDDRERSFENGLARHLRLGATAGNDPESCFDPETLAAYHERSLSPEEMNSCKRHVVGCARCQQVLAHVEATEDLGVGLETSENVLVMKKPDLSGRALSGEEAHLPAPMAAAPAQILRSNAASQATASPRSQRKAPWVWLAPAGAIAAGLLVWVAWHESKPAGISPQSSIQVAENRQPSSVPVTVQPVPQPPLARIEENKSVSPSKKITSTYGRADAGTLKQQQTQLGDKAADALSRSETADAFSKRESDAKGVIAGASRDADQSKIVAEIAPRLKEKNRQGAGVEPVPPPPLSQPGFVANETAAVPLAEGARPAAPPTPAKAAVGDIAGLNTSAEISTQSQMVTVSGEPRANNLRVFAGPGKKAIWRTGPAGSIEHSTDGGAAWIPQDSGVTADLLAGSAPSGNICWVVGRSGTILRTTDGGAHWTKLTSPVNEDLAGVRAKDALHAWVWVVMANQKPSVTNYTTSDGGVTWTRIPGE